MELTGLVGWRGMVGSVLLERMAAEGDFELIEPRFFSTSDKGGAAPVHAKNETRLHDAFDIEALRQCQTIITAQGGDYTKDVYPRLRAAGWKGFWIDAAGWAGVYDAEDDGWHGVVYGPPSAAETPSHLRRQR